MEKPETTSMQEVKQVQRDKLGRLLPGSTANPGGRPKGTAKALRDIEVAIEQYEGEHKVPYWTAATLVAMRLAKEGHTALLSKLLDKFVSSKFSHEGADTAITVTMPTVIVDGKPMEFKVGDAA